MPIIDSATAELLMPILQNPELYDPEMVPNSHFNDEMDALSPFTMQKAAIFRIRN